jgi:uncharacterized membrane protein
MNGNTMIGNVIPAFLLVLAGAMLALLYNESQERKQLLLAIAATVVASFCLAILVIEHF